jgi:hypothetical protein
MTLSDTRLPDPSAKAVHAAIESAFRAVSAHGITARISHTKISVKRVAERAATEPEGDEFWGSRTTVATGVAGQVSVSWWTAVSGRRHVRIVARLITPETSYLLNAAKRSTRPAVWHVFPDRVYRRRMGKENNLVAVCGCGAVGTEKALGWAGPCCGPCADYLEEHGALPWKRPALLPTPSPCTAVAASADGRRVAAVSADGTDVRVWDTDAPEEPVHVWNTKTEDAAVAQIALSATGRFLALAGRTNDRLHVLDLRAESRHPAVQMAPTSAVAFHPVTGALYFVTGGMVLTASPPGARAHGSGVPGAIQDGPLAFSRDGARLAVQRNDDIHVHETATGAQVTAIQRPYTIGHPLPMHVRPPPPIVAQVAFSPDGGQIAVGFGRAVAVYHAVTGARRFHNGDLADAASGVAFDPGGKWLFVGRHDGTLGAYHTDTFAEDRSVMLRWSLGPIRALATCGDSLLAACDEGAQLWPMAQLLEGL